MSYETIAPAAAIPAKRFILRPLRASDAGLMALYTSDKRVAEGTTSIPHPLPPGTSEAFIARVIAPGSDEIVWAIDASEFGGGELLGVI